MTLRAWLVVLILFASAPSIAMTRIKDISDVRGVRGNQLVGYGLVIGLNGTGDGLRNAPFTQQSIQSMLDRMGVNIRGGQTRTKNVAAVMITAELPPFSAKGQRIDVAVSSLGDAKSLAGGTLVMTSLSGADEKIYAVAQGPVAVAGLSATGASQSVTQGVPTSGRISNGAFVERDAPGTFALDGSLELQLRNPDFRTAMRVVDAVNAYGKIRYGLTLAREKDFRSIELRKPKNISSARLFAEIGDLYVEPDQTARVVIDERSGTIVIGQDVRISAVAVSHGKITVKVDEFVAVSQPQPFSTGETVAVPKTEISVAEEGGSVSQLRGASLQELVSALNKMGLKPQGIIAILEAIKAAGALQAELVVQ